MGRGIFKTDFILQKHYDSLYLPVHPHICLNNYIVISAMIVMMKYPEVGQFKVRSTDYFIIRYCRINPIVLNLHRSIYHMAKESSTDHLRVIARSPINARVGEVWQYQQCDKLPGCLAHSNRYYQNSRPIADTQDLYSLMPGLNEVCLDQWQTDSPDSN